MSIFSNIDVLALKFKSISTYQLIKKILEDKMTLAFLEAAQEIMEPLTEEMFTKS